MVEFDPRIKCQQFKDVNPFLFDACMSSPIPYEQTQPPTAGGTIYHLPPQTSLTSAINFELTQKWSASWNTSYDFELHQFAAQAVTLQRDLHDWRAIFAFTRPPNGNFAFTFNIALKPQPELKFDYSRATVGGR